MRQINRVPVFARYRCHAGNPALHTRLCAAHKW